MFQSLQSYFNIVCQEQYCPVGNLSITIRNNCETAEYGVTAWNSFQKHLINIIENLQWRGPKEILGISGGTYTFNIRDMIELFKPLHHCYNESSLQSMMKSM